MIRADRLVAMCELQSSYCFTSPLQISQKNISCGHSVGNMQGGEFWEIQFGPVKLTLITPPFQVS